MTKVIIAGSRTITDYDWLKNAILRSGFVITEVVSGKEPNGVDRLGEIWAEKHGIPVKEFKADWQLYGRSGGPIRNSSMAKYADAAVILRVRLDLKSNGSDDLFKKMNLLHKPVYREIQSE